MAFRAALLIFVISYSHVFGMESKMLFSKNLVVFDASQEAMVVGTICNINRNKCVQVTGAKSYLIGKIEFKSGDVIAFTGDSNGKKITFLRQYSSKSDFEWVEKIILVATGALIGFFGNVLLAILNAVKKEKSEQRQKIRLWRDKMLASMVASNHENVVVSPEPLPQGLDRNRLREALDAISRIQDINNRMNAQPSEKEKLIDEAKVLLMDLN